MIWEAKATPIFTACGASREEAVVVAAAVTDAIAPSVEGHGGDEDHVDFSPVNRTEQALLRRPDSVMACFQFVETVDPAGRQFPTLHVAEGNDNPLPLSPTPADQIVGPDLAPETEVDHQCGGLADFLRSASAW